MWQTWGRGRTPGPRVAAVGAWPVPRASCGRRGGVAGPLGPVWPPWGRGRSPGHRMVAVWEWPVPWAPYGRRWGVVGPLGPVWPPMWLSRSNVFSDTFSNKLRFAKSDCLRPLGKQASILQVVPFLTHGTRSNSAGEPFLTPSIHTLRFRLLVRFGRLDRHPPIRPVEWFWTPCVKRSDSKVGQFWIR